MTDKERNIEGISKTVKHRGTLSIGTEATLIQANDEHRETFPWGLPGSFGRLPVRHGTLRSDFTTLSVRSDAEAVAAWIAEKASRSTNTAQSYRREVERLMLWASETKDKALSELMLEDFLEFATFLSDPQPAEAWISKRRHNRSSPCWRPFMGPLSPSSSKQSQIIIGSLFRFLHKKGWIRANPVPDPILPQSKTNADGAPQYIGKEGGGPLSRSLTHTQWAAVERAIDALPCASKKEQLFAGRTRWILTLFHNCGPRVSEVATHGMGSIKPMKHRGRTIWVWFIVGKGKKLREVPMSEDVVMALSQFRTLLGLSPYPAPLESIPLAPSFWTLKSDGKVESEKLKPLTRQSLYTIVTGVMESAADILGRENEEYESLCRASTHWLRHTALKDLADNTDDLRYVQQVAGHADIKTTMIYTNAKTHELYDAIENARNQSKKRSI
jgi:site-specific recombinase XerD